MAKTLAELKKSIKEIQDVKGAIRKKKENGLFTDADDKFVADHEAKAATFKGKLSKALDALAKPLAVKPTDDVDDINEFVCECVQEGDNTKGNLDVIRSLIKKCPIDYPALCEERALLSETTSDGNLEFLEVLLAIKDVRFDAVDLLTTAMYSQMYRIPAVLKILKYEKTLNLPEILDDVQSVFQDFLHEIASKKKAIQRENRTGRLELIEKLLAHPVLKLDPSHEGSDCQTLFSRAAFEGDVDLMALLLGSKKVEDINRIQSDRTTALIQAVIGNCVPAVMTMLTQKGLDINYKCDDGTAQELAVSLCRDPAIQQALKLYKPGGGLSSAKAEPAAKAGAAAKDEKKDDKKDDKKADDDAADAAAPPAKPPTGKKSAAAGGKTVMKPTPPASKAPAARGRRPSEDVNSPPSKKPSEVSAAKKSTATSDITEAGKAVFKQYGPLVRGVFLGWVSRVKARRVERQQQLTHRFVSFAKNNTRMLQRLWFRDWLRALYQAKFAKLLDKLYLGVCKKYGVATGGGAAGGAANGGLAPPSSAVGGKRAPSAAPGKRPAGKAPAAAKGASAAKPTTTGGGFSIGDLVEVLKLTRLSIESMVSMGIFTDEEEKKKKDAEAKVEETKKQLMNDLTENYKKKKLKYDPSEDEKESIEGLVDYLIADLDTKSCNAALFKLLLEAVNLDWPTLCEEHSWLSQVCCDGSLEYIQSLLSYPHIKFDTVDVVLTALYNQQYRIPCTALLLRHEPILKLEEHIDELQQPFQDFVAEIASKRKEIQRENRTGRLQLIEKLLTHKLIKIDPNYEGDDSQTVFSRAAYEGDHELMSLMLKLKKAPDINRAQGDNTTALIQAVFSNSVPTVALILTQPGVGVNHIGPDGTALTIGITLQRDLGIVQKLKSLGGKRESELPPPSATAAASNANGKGADDESDTAGLGRSGSDANLAGGAKGGGAKAGGPGGAVVVPDLSDARKRRDTLEALVPAEKKKELKKIATGAKTVVKKKF